ncbi:zinc finger BED domain-containing protein RICESLEEPER 2 [Artemisia annua]|uniref:Zinc finger BED domain-containing protein RICESLEEPER 2 n=1 Tax=Artemisia annua TaxID=35608 RepID=A0A2U1NUZ5_ARTAN|nr:zinc finger BED domain-containing protein RICESLEEPER 2 [Artemisia annua]
MVHFTTDTWTSHCQRVNYMAVIAHFIDEEWVMHKRIINFRPTNSHKGDDIGRKLLECVHEWGIKNVMTITVENASSNDKALDFLIQRLPNIYDGGKHFQIRCFAHILNLIVKKGLTELDDSVQRVTKTVRYIKNSTQRISKFKKCIEDSEITTKRFLVSDCATRWNSTYDMLKVANELKDAFYIDILDIDTQLRKWQSKPAFKVMATKMRTKYERYLGKLLEINDFMYFVVLLDPTMKSQLISHGFRKIISSSSCMCESMEPEATSPTHGDNDFLNDFYNGNDTSSIEPETELQRYLKEPKVELRKGQTFDILQWWKASFNSFSKTDFVRSNVDLHEDCQEILPVPKSNNTENLPRGSSGNPTGVNITPALNVAGQKEKWRYVEMVMVGEGWPTVGLGFAGKGGQCRSLVLAGASADVGKIIFMRLIKMKIRSNLDSYVLICYNKPSYPWLQRKEAPMAALEVSGITTAVNGYRFGCAREATTERKKQQDVTGKAVNCRKRVRKKVAMVGKTIGENGMAFYFFFMDERE